MKRTEKIIWCRLRPAIAKWPDMTVEQFEDAVAQAGPEGEYSRVRMDGPLDESGKYGILVPVEHKSILGDRSWVLFEAKEKCQFVFDALHDDMKDEEFQRLGMIIGSSHPIFTNQRSNHSLETIAKENYAATSGTGSNRENRTRRED